MKMEPAKSFVAGKSLRGLSYALRHPETWPTGFKWKFVDCHRCAMGLAAELAMVERPTPAAMARAFVMSDREADKIFCGYSARHCGVITADEVADRIDDYLSQQSGSSRLISV